ncbi:sensor histidine kinase [Wenjunlia tyrosinilytica]|uniref:sensor histidine kinase n=1 Tax=Wenjunlia tyrosinilytica TaxID=1544741 RepID=UPI0016635CFB|nr:nitrate- and nitrite sensing domain-containing protein [Wenjunlia tyrosinilytica]
MSSDDSGDFELPAASGNRLALHNWRVPTRLMAILFIPVVTGLIFAGLRVANSVDFAQQAAEAERVAKLARSATTLADALQNERDATALPLTRGQRNAPIVTQFREKTDAAMRRFESDVSKIHDNTRVENRIKAAQANLASLPLLRTNAFRSDLMPLATPQAYSEMFRPLTAFDNELGFGSTKVTSRGRAVYAVSLAKASSSTKRALVMTALARDTMTRQDPIAIQAAVTLQVTADTEFLTGALPEDVLLYNETVTGDQLRDSSNYLTRVLSVPPGKSLSAAGLQPNDWYKASSVEIGLLRKVELKITDHLVGDAQEIRANAEKDAVINGAAALLALALAGLLTFFVSRSMVRGMGVLRTSAIDIAENRLPSLVENLSKTDPGRIDTRVKPIPLFGRDEIGEVARAFDQVHRETVRLAAEQALLRGNVNAIFTNLSRRNQGLIQRQLTLITDLENHETEPDQLENLFKLDHLATRMRRNGENLLVLAGEEPGRRWTQPVPLVDVLRAAASEVEQYERVELFGIPETEIHGTAVNDLVHLLAELLENATSFSSPQTKVRVNGTRLPDGRVMVEIHDKGIGLTPEDFADINHKLAEPPTVDVSIARRMGLFVVGRLAKKHGVRVQLRPSGESAGTTSLVMLPEPITHGGAAPVPDSDFTVSRIVPEHEMNAYEDSARTAADLGFDESRYAVAEEPDAPALDSMGRSLKRRERRAALEASQGAASSEAQEQQERPLFRDEAAASASAPAPAPAPAGNDFETQAFNPFDNQPPYLDDRFFGNDPPSGAGNGLGNGQDPQQGQDGGQDESGYGLGFEGSQDYAGQDYPGQGYAGPEYEGQGYAGQGYEGQEYEGRNGFEDRSGFTAVNGYGGRRTTERDLGREFDEYYAGGHPSYGEQPQYDTGQFESEQYDAGQYAEQPSYDTSEFDNSPYSEQSQYTQEFGQDDYTDYDAGTSEQPQPAQPDYAPEGYGDAPSDEDVGFTENGLPRRRPGTQAPGSGQETWRKPAQTPSEEPAARDDSASANAVSANADDSEWRSANDDTWRRAAKVREPQAGGVTPSGLPRRVPKANLVPGTAQQTPQGGPQVSRAPDEVRGRLTSLRRGIQQGRSAVSDSNGEGPHSPDHQER